jgi:uncharacterized Zn finger protein
MKKSIENIKCSVCGKVTKHFLNSKGEYRCLVCNSVNKTVKVPEKDLEVVFEADKSFIKALNPELTDEMIEAVPMVED